MRILYVTDALAVWGGVERVLSDKFNYLVKKLGYEVFVVTADQGEHPIPFILDSRVVVKDFNINFHRQYHLVGFKRFRKHRELGILYRNCLSSYIKEIRPDIISCIREGCACAVLDVKGSIPAIFESHAMFKDVIYEKSTFIHRCIVYFQRKKFWKLDKIVTLSQGDADDWKRVCKHVCVIPNVVHLNDTGRYSNCTSKKVIFAGRFDLQKGIDSLAQIWSLVQTRHPDWLLEVYGNGELKPFFTSIVKEKELNIDIFPAVPDIFDKYIDASILLMTSFYEPFGLVLAEAMSCGLPVVAFNCPYGPADIIENGKDGFLVENGNIQVFAERICQLIENEQLRCEMGKAASISSQRYNAEIVMPMWDKLFSEITQSIK